MDERGMEEALHEVRLLSQFDHTNIVHYYEAVLEVSLLPRALTAPYEVHNSNMRDAVGVEHPLMGSACVLTAGWDVILHLHLRSQHTGG